MKDGREDAIAGYLKHLRRRNYALSTIRNRRCTLRRIQNWFDEDGTDLREAGQADIESFLVWLAKERKYRGKNLAPRTRGEYVGALKSFFLYLQDESLILRNPAERLKSPRTRKKIHRDALSIGEVRQLLDAHKTDDVLDLRTLALLHILIFTGLRGGEVCRLNLDEVDLKTRELMVRKGKGSKDRIVFFDPDTRQVLARYLVQSRAALTSKRETAFIVNDSGHRLQMDRLRQITTHAASRARIRRHLVLHSFRRTFCMLLLSAGCSIRVIAELAGHDRLSTTSRYTHLDISELSSIYRQTHPRSVL